MGAQTAIQGLLCRVFYCDSLIRLNRASLVQFTLNGVNLCNFLSVVIVKLRFFASNLSQQTPKYIDFLALN